MRVCKSCVVDIHMISDGMVRLSMDATFSDVIDGRADELVVPAVCWMDMPSVLVTSLPDVCLAAAQAMDRKAAEYMQMEQSRQVALGGPVHLMGAWWYEA